MIPDSPAITDLLNRGSFVDNIYKSIKNLNIEGAFVIGIYGRWGEGKTTILKFVSDRIKKDKNLIVFKFDPWYFNSQDAIIRSFFNSLCNELGKNYLALDLIALISSYRDLLVASLEPFKLNKAASVIFPGIESRKTVENLKVKIESKLKKMNKKIIILIDDIDRMDKNEILLVFKLIKLCSDFENFIYIVSMDKERVDNILKDDLTEDDKYIEKIIQVGVEIPKVEKEIISRILINYVNKLFEHYNISLNSEDEDKLGAIFPYIAKLCFDVRNVKRYINMLSLRFAQVGDEVNKFNFFIIETIEYFFPQKFREIYKNKDKFVYYSTNFEVHLNSNKNNERKHYYNQFFEDVDNSEILKKLLASIFTSIKNYSKNYNNLISDNKIIYDNLKNHPIEDSNFFDLYFTLEKNRFTIINQTIEKFVEVINAWEEEEVLKYAKMTFESMETYDEQLSFFESFKGYIKYISTDKYKIVTETLFQFSYLLEDTGGGFSLSPYHRVEAVTVDLIERVQNNEQREELLLNIVGKCKDLEFIRGVLYFSKTLAERDIKFSTIREQSIHKFKERLEKEYIKPRKNIFEENQKYNGIWAFTNYIKDKQQISQYYYDLLSKNIEYTAKFLLTFKKVSNCSSGGRSWEVISFDKKGFEEYFDKNTLKLFVDKYDKLGKSESSVEQHAISLFKEYYDGKVTDSIW